jgi:DNA polymerase I-like protein with 3'-5' exonuclease and polymerase domains
MSLFIDIETTAIPRGALPDVLHFCCVSEDGNEPYNVETKEELRVLLAKHKKIIAHNGIFFDFPTLEKIWNIDFSGNILIDTLLMSYICAPQLRQIDNLEPKKFNGRHSLKAWGIRLGFPKDEYTGGWEFANPAMLKYCLQDVRLLVAVYSALKGSTFYDEDVIAREHKIHSFMADIYLKGVPIKGENELYDIINNDMNDAVKEVRELGFEGNLNSRQQVAKFLIEKQGWKPTVMTPTGRPQVNDDTLPKGSPFRKYYATQKPLSQLVGIIKKLVNSRLYPTISTSATRTSRATHTNPNIGQIPAVQSGEERWDSKYGKEFRGIFTHEKDEIMVGADLKSLELRCLAEALLLFGGKRDWIDMLESGKDVHAENQKALELPDRTKAKRTIFLCVYGGGVKPLALIVGSLSLARKTLKRLLTNIPGYRKLKNSIERVAKRLNYVILPNGRKLFVVQPYTALNTLLQGMGAEVSKYWLLNIMEEVDKLGLRVRLLLYVHDEYQFSCHVEDVDEFKLVLKRAVRKVHKQFGTTMTFDCDIKVGETWKDTH